MAGVFLINDCIISLCTADAPCRDHKGICYLHTERCKSYRSYKYIPFTYYQSLRNSYNVYTFMIRSNRGYSGGKNSEEVPVGTNHESVHVIRVT